MPLVTSLVSLTVRFSPVLRVPTTVSQQLLVAAPEAATGLSCEAARLGGVVRGCEDRVPDGLLGETPLGSRQSVTGRRPNPQDGCDDAPSDCTGHELDKVGR